MATLKMDWIAFTQSKGNGEALESLDSIMVHIDYRDDLSKELSEELSKITINLDPGLHPWHGSFIKLSVNCDVMVLGEAATFQDIIKSDQESSLWLLKIRVQEKVNTESVKMPMEEKRDIGAFIGKIGKSVMPRESK